MPFVCLVAVEHLQGVFAFIILCWVKDFNPDFLHTAASLCPGFLVNPLIPTWKGEWIHLSFFPPLLHML